MQRIFARGFILFLAGVLVVVLVLMSAAVLQTYRQYETMRKREIALAVQLEKKQDELRNRQEYLRLVLEDPHFLERVVREKLGYARPDETIFRFDQ